MFLLQKRTMGLASKMSMTATVMMMVLMVLMMLMRMMMRTMMMMTIIVMMLQRTYFAMRIPGRKIRIL